MPDEPVEPPAPVTPPPPAPPAQQPPPTATSEPLPSNDDNDLEHWKEVARKNEKRARDNAGAAKRLAEIEAANQTELEKAQGAATAAEQRAAAAELELTRHRVAVAKGLPADMASRLQGDDEKAMQADADVLLAAMGGPPKPGVPQVPAGARGQGSESIDMNAAIRQAAGRG